MNRPDRRIITLFVFPIIALLACMAAALLIPEDKPFIPDQHALLEYVNELRLSAEASLAPADSVPIRDVFLRPLGQRGTVTISLVVQASSGAYAIVNGQRLGPGERTDDFCLAAISGDAVTLTYNDGSKETFHVKAP